MAKDTVSYWKLIGKVALFALFCGVASLPLFGFYVHLLNSVGEFIFSKKLVAICREERVCWLSGYYDSGHALKPSIARLVSPRIAVIGSSRVMQFRAEMFKKVSPHEFYNLGGGSRDMTDATLNLLGLLKESQNVECVLLGLDWWWFQIDGRDAAVKHPGGPGPSKFGLLRSEIKRELENWKEFLLDQIQLLQRAWRDEKFWKAMERTDNREARSKRLLLGLGAASGGFRNDGSYLYSKTVFEFEKNPPSPEMMRREGIKRFNSGLYRGNAIDPKAVLQLRRFMEICSKNRISTIVLLPPLEQEVLEMFQDHSASRDFWRAFPSHVASLCRQFKTPVFDFSGPPILRIDHRHFIDWFHGSEVVFLKMLLAMAQDPEAQPILAKYVDQESMELQMMGAKSNYSIYGD